MILNPYSENERLEVMMACCFKAAQSHFSHLPVRDIINPPHECFDAALARQVAIHILHVVFRVPRRRIVILQGRARASIATAIQTVERRMECRVFARAYGRMAGRAKDLFSQQLEKAAA